MSTAACVSKITYIDGDKGELLYRGYPIEQLAVNCDFLEVCYLLLQGELPNASAKADFVHNVTQHTMVHEQMSQFFRGFRRDSHPMAMLVGVVGSLSAFYHDSLDITDALIGQYEGSSRGLLQYSFVLDQLWFSRDPVALDTLAIKELEHERRALDAPEFKPNLELYANAALLQQALAILKQ